MLMEFQNKTNIEISGFQLMFWIHLRWVRYRFVRYRFVRHRLRFVRYRYPQWTFCLFPRRLEDVFKIFLQDIYKTCFKPCSRSLQRNNFSSFKTSWRGLGSTLKTCWRCLQDVLKINKYFLGNFLSFSPCQYQSNHQKQDFLMITGNTSHWLL